MKNGYIKIENKGEMDINSLLLMGATNKRGNDRMIGYFGSGLKYAMAVLLKFKIPFRIFAGEKEITVTTSRKDFRGTKFDVIKINNKLTNMTTDMGPDWKAWFAVREIYCNAIDESEHSLGISDKAVGEKGRTIFYIEFGEELKHMFTNWDKYFSDKRNDIAVDSKEHKTKMFSGNSSDLIIYRKGIQCHYEESKSLYHYDLGWVDINESRVLSSVWDLRHHLPQIIAQIADRGVVKNIFDNYSGTFEAGLEWQYAHSFNDEWLSVINGRTLVVDKFAGHFQEEIASNPREFLLLPDDMVQALKDYFSKKVTVMGLSHAHESGIKIQMTTKQAEYVTDALAFLKKGDIEIKAPIAIYEFKNEIQLGEAKNGEIRLSSKIFDMGKRVIVATILEEASHLDSGSGDKTRAFQDYLFNKLINLLEDRVGERL